MDAVNDMIDKMGGMWLFASFPILKITSHKYRCAVQLGQPDLVGVRALYLDGAHRHAHRAGVRALYDSVVRTRTVQ